MACVCSAHRAPAMSPASRASSQASRSASDVRRAREAPDVARVLALEALLQAAGERVVAVVGRVHAGVVHLVVVQARVVVARLPRDLAHGAGVETGADQLAEVGALDLPQPAAPDAAGRRRARRGRERGRGRVDGEGGGLAHACRYRSGEQCAR